MYFDPNAGEFGTFYFAEDCPEIPKGTAAIVCPNDIYTAVQPIDIDAMHTICDLIECDIASITEPEPNPMPKSLCIARSALMCATFMFALLGIAAAESIPFLLSMFALAAVCGVVAYIIDKNDFTDESFFYRKDELV